MGFVCFYSFFSSLRLLFLWRMHLVTEFLMNRCRLVKETDGESRYDNSISELTPLSGSCDTCNATIQ